MRWLWNTRILLLIVCALACHVSARWIMSLDVSLAARLIYLVLTALVIGVTIGFASHE